MPPFEALYAAWPICPSNAATDAVSTIRPRSPSPSGSRPVISAVARRNRLKLPIKLTSTVRRNSSSGNGPSRPTMRPAVPMPAQATARRAGPCRSRAAATARSVSAAFVTSQAAAKPPVSLATATAAASLMSSTATRAPACANANAVARPSPEPPPLISAAWPVISIFQSSAPSASAHCRPRRRNSAAEARQLGLAMRDIDRRTGNDRRADPGPAVADLAE